jgi:uncharacterized protein YndB with AHSA1/START domain
MQSNETLVVNPSRIGSIVRTIKPSALGWRHKLDYKIAFGIEDRIVNDRDHQGQPVRVVSAARVYDAEIEQLWDVTTNGQRIPRWFASITGDLKLGGRYQLKGNAGGEITRCESPKAFDITWEFGGSVGWVTVRLDSIEKGTRLTLEHLMSKDKASEAHWGKYGPGATGVGWEFGFLGLGLYLENEEPVIESETNTWAASADGKSFISNSARQWGEAHIRAGEDRSTAESMARATAAFYCGES